MSEIIYDTMVDIETYDNIPTASIASIGAVRFNIKTREIKDEFYVTVEPKSCKDYGLTFSRETMDWWLKQNPLALKALRINNISLPAALTQFQEYFNVSPNGNICCWGMFDVPVLDHAYRKVNLKSPWLYYKTVECRTIANLYNLKIDRSSVVHHNALDDAKNQAKFIINLFNPEEIPNE